MSEPQFVDGRVVGTLDGGVFEQNVLPHHIYRRFMAKGIDYQLYRSLKGRCRLWRLRITNTGQVLTIPFGRIEQAGFPFQPGRGSGRQIMVKLEFFDEDVVGAQRRLL